MSAQRQLNNVVQFKQVKLGSVAVVKITHHLNDAFYIGRFNSAYNLPRSPLANKPLVKGATREAKRENLLNYRAWIVQQINGKTEVYEELIKFRDLILNGMDVKLGCWCKTTGIDDDKPCHGDIVKGAIELLVNKYLSKQNN